MPPRAVAVATENVTRWSAASSQSVLRSSQLESLKGLLGKLPAAAYLCDSNGLITYFNDHAIQIWGRAPYRFGAVHHSLTTRRIAIAGRLGFIQWMESRLLTTNAGWP
jgi:hypothetical protein